MAPPYLITSLNEMPGKDRWVRGVADVLRDTVQPVIIMWEPEFAVPEHWIVRRMRRSYAGHLHKLAPLLDMDLDLDRWFVFTDGSDVLFQTPLPDLSARGCRVLLSNEGVRHQDNDFWRPHLALPLYTALREQPIYNVGSWAAIGHDFVEFLRYLRATLDLCQERGWPVTHVHEQLIYNRWVHAHRAKCGELPGLFCTLYANYTGPGFGGRRTARLVNGRFVTADGQPYAVVHANGSTKHVLDDLPVAGGDPAPQPALALRTGE